MTSGLPPANVTTIRRQFSAREFVKVRAATDGEQSFLVWQGALYSLVPEEPKRHLFNFVGMSVARCPQTPEGDWDFTSRELLFYLDPQSDEIVHRWQNPWTEETVPVIHVANSPVQGHFGQNRAFPAEVTGDITTFTFNLFPFYPNPLADDLNFTDYSPQTHYQAVELFKLTVPTADLEDPVTTTVSRLLLSWERIGPWLPWMKMGNRPGQLIYSASGHKVSDFTALPLLLQTQLNERLPLFKQAATQKLDVEDMTSWEYFKHNFQAYLRGEEFPLVALTEG
jgi:hypothetical protein